MDLKKIIKNWDQDILERAKMINIKTIQGKK